MNRKEERKREESGKLLSERVQQERNKREIQTGRQTGGQNDRQREGSC